MGKEPALTTRKSVNLPNDLWAEISDFRFTRRIGSEAEALRQLLLAGLRADRSLPNECPSEAPCSAVVHRDMPGTERP